MKLDEIVVVPPMKTSGVDLSKIDQQSERHVFDIESNPVFEYAEVNGTARLYVLKINSTPASYVSYSIRTIDGYQYLYLDRAFTVEQFRGKGYALKIIVQLRKMTNKKMIGDENLTADGIKMWNNLAKVLPVKILDFTTGQMYAFDEVPTSQLVTTNQESNKHVFVIETLNALEVAEIDDRGLKEGMIHPMKYYMIEQDDILSRV